MRLHLAFWLTLASACGSPRPSPFTPAETDAALAPARDLWARCYAGTELERSEVAVKLDYDLNVVPTGHVHSVPRAVEPDRPALVECVRHRLDELRFPARAKDRVSVHFELGPRGATAAGPQLDRARASGTCQPACGDGLACHYEARSPRGVCRVTTGRCRFGGDCAPTQACEHLSQPLGVCVDPRP